MKKISFLFFGFIFFVISISAIAVPVKTWAEEKCDSLGPNNGGAGNVQHSTFHYDLVKLLAFRMGFSMDTAETIARYSALTDQVNAKPGYPNPSFSLNNSDTFPAWNESVAGTERPGLVQNSLGETPAVYWHFATRDPSDTLTGGFVYGSAYPSATGSSYSNTPYYWRIPFSFSLTTIEQWALYSIGGADGLPPDSPDTVFYFNLILNQYVLVPKGSLMALGIFLHSLADSYSHEKCMMLDTIRSHPLAPSECAAAWHRSELPYNLPGYGLDYTEKTAQAIWRVLREYKRINGISHPALWSTDINGFEDGDGIPDELEDDGDSDHSESFMEKWKSASTVNLNPAYDAIINHYDHTTHRIQLVDSGLVEPAGFRDELISNDLEIINLFPNPAKTILEIKYAVRHSSNAVLKIYDETARMVIQKQVFANAGNSNSIEIDIRNLSCGKYFLNFESSGKSAGKVFIKK